MKISSRFLSVLLLLVGPVAWGADDLLSWNDGAVKQTRPDHVNDGPGKPVGIQRFIGRSPVFAFGNSDGDLQMLQWTTAGAWLRFAGIVHHTDAEREWAYDRASKIGKLDKALDQASAKGWSVVDMKRDWNRIYPGNP